MTTLGEFSFVASGWVAVSNLVMALKLTPPLPAPYQPPPPYCLYLFSKLRLCLRLHICTYLFLGLHIYLQLRLCLYLIIFCVSVRRHVCILVCICVLDYVFISKYFCLYSLSLIFFIIYFVNLFVLMVHIVYFI